jgi:hypothetical protein
MYCPDCGAEVGDANFCASCGADLKGVREKLKRRPGGKTTGSLAGKSGGANGAARPAAAAAVPAKGPSAALLWGIVGVVVVVVVVAVMLLTGDSTTGDQTGGGTQPAASATPVAIDTSGGYQQLVHRGNRLYNKGNSLFQSSQIEQGAEYFKAAAVAYMAAWRKQPGDPNLGTDLATALFYSGNTEGALTQIDSVLKDNPEFQPALFNKGNYLAHAASFAEQSGQQKQADKLYAEAKRVLTKAIALDPASDVGKAADERLQSLPK